jgi:signal transduction histidine kinase
MGQFSVQLNTLGVLQLTEASVDRMAGLIDDVMDFARGRLGGGITLNRTPAKVDLVLRQVVDELKTSHPGREIVCDFLLPQQIDVDASRIGQMVSNLLANALAYGDPKEPIWVRSGLENDQLTLSVINAGPPISQEAMKRLFQPFFRGEIRSNQQGLGLGLHIASEIAKAHGGQLAVESSPAKTCFTFAMPVCQSALKTDPQ